MQRRHAIASRCNHAFDLMVFAACDGHGYEPIGKNRTDFSFDRGLFVFQNDPFEEPLGKVLCHRML